MIGELKRYACPEFADQDRFTSFDWRFFLLICFISVNPSATLRTASASICGFIIYKFLREGKVKLVFSRWI